jgi:hypothetical protein
MWCLCTYRALETLGKCWSGTWFGGLELRTTGRYQVPVSVSKNQTGTESDFGTAFGTGTRVLVFSLRRWVDMNSESTREQVVRAHLN